MNICPRRCRAIALFVALLGWVAPLAAQNLVIRGGTLIDGTGKAPQRGVTILIRSGKIEAIGPDVKVPSGVKVVEADGKFIIPGLIDARVEIGPSPGNRVSRGEVQIE